MWKSARRRRLKYHSIKRRTKKINVLYRLALFSFFGLIGLFLLSFIAFPLLALDLPSPDKVVRREGFSTKIYDRNGVLLYDIFADERRTHTTLDQVPEYLQQATIAIEDKNFYKHQGFDLFGIVRGFSRLFTVGRAQGGSTLTQQLVKNVLLSPERTIIRKAKEFILAVQIERKYNKDEILQMYFNEAPYGGTAWGVQAAAEIYFDKDVAELTLVESAILAGLPQRPSFYSPYGGNSKAYIERSQQVLRRMREDSYISQEQEDEAREQLASVEFAGRGASFKAPHFVVWVKSLLEEKYGEASVEQGGLRITTTLDWELQKEAQNAVAEEIAKVEGLHITNGAGVVIDPGTGEILAMVGSKDFAAENYDGQFNVTLSPRQPGSAIKPVTYVTALKKGYTAATLLMDTPTVFPGGVDLPEYEPKNYDGKFRGPVQLRYALGNSINVPAVKLLSLVGVKSVLETAYDLGITTLEPTAENLSRLGLSVTLGGGEVRLLDLTAAYSAFANGGVRVEPVAVLKVEDASGKVLEEYKASAGRQVLSPEEAYLISNILSDNSAREEVFGPRSALFIPGRDIAVKTGTTNDQKDNWTIGWSPQVIVGVWVGNNDNTSMKSVASGVTGASPIWRRIILTALAGKPNESWEVPKNIVSSEVDIVSGYRVHDAFASRMEYFIKGTEPIEEDTVHTKLKICRGEGKLATPSQIAAGEIEEREYYVFSEEDPFGPPNRWQEGILTWLGEKSDPKYHPPSDYCGSGNPVNVEFVTPKDKQRIEANNFEVRVDPKSTSEIVEVEIEIDGQKYLLSSPPWIIEIKDIKDGVYTLSARAKDKSGKISDRSITIGVRENP